MKLLDGLVGAVRRWFSSLSKKSKPKTHLALRRGLVIGEWKLDRIKARDEDMTVTYYFKKKDHFKAITVLTPFCLSNPYSEMGLLDYLTRKLYKD